MATQITALPDPPSRADPANFAAKGDAFLGALPTFRTEANLLATEAEQDAATATAQAATATTQATNAATSATNSQNFATQVGSAVTGFAGQYSSREWATGTFVPDGSSKEWATLTGTTVITGEYSSKEWSIGTTVPDGSSKEWATLTGTTVITGQYSAKEWAIGTTVPDGSAKFWSGVGSVAANYQGLYSAATTYSRGQTVSNTAGKIYVSTVNANTGQSLDNLAFWVPIDFSSPLGTLSFIHNGGY